MLDTVVVAVDVVAETELERSLSMASLLLRMAELNVVMSTILGWSKTSQILLHQNPKESCNDVTLGFYLDFCFFLSAAMTLID